VDNLKLICAVTSVGALAAILLLNGRNSAPSSRLTTQQVSDPGKRNQALNAFAGLPVAFVENRGQTDPRVRFYARGLRFAFYLTPEEVMLHFVSGVPKKLLTRAAAVTPTETHQREMALALRFPGANPRVAPEGEQRAPGVRKRSTASSKAADRMRSQAS
jgi:hypothetical protein